MFDLIDSGNAPLTMTSREIAELTGKRHKNVLRDIEVMLDELGLDCIDFAVALPDSHGRMKPSFHLPKRETLILLTRFPRPVNQRVIDQWEAWEALETDKATPAAVPTNRASEDMVVLSALETGKAVPAVSGAVRAAEDMAVLAALADGLRLEGSARLGVMRKGMEIVAPHLLPAVPISLLCSPVLGSANFGQSRAD
jgi:hypothetical protein